LALTTEQTTEVEDLAIKCGFNDKLNRSNFSVAIEHILYFEVIDKRKAQLDSMKAAFTSSGMARYLGTRGYLIRGLFPRSQDLKIPLSLLLDRIDYVGDSTVCQKVQCYLQNLSGMDEAKS
jgi:hypothetical protein